jgi:TonB family protein
LRTLPTFAAGSGRRNAAGFFRWEDSGEPIAVHFHLNAVELLDRDAIRAGSNITAGILLGKREEGPQATLVIENYEPVPIATWKTTDSPFGDRRQVKAMIDRWNSRPHRRMDVLGFYRNSVAGEKTLTEDDLSVSGENSSQPESLFLLIEPRLGQPSNGRLFLTKDAAVAWEWSPTPFNRAELSGRGSPRRTEVRNAPPKKEIPRIFEQPKRVSAPMEDAPPNESKPDRQTGDWNFENWKDWNSKGGVRKIAALAVVVLLAIGIFQFRNRVTAPATPPKAQLPVDSGLSLKFERAGSDVRLTWNPEAAAILNATGGQLIITDGPISKTVNLDPSDLKRGSITYSPLTDDLVLRLQVNTPDASGPVAESVRIVGGLPTLPTAPADPSADPSSALQSRTTPPSGHQPLSDAELQQLINKTSASVNAPSDLRPKPRVKLPEETLTVSKVLPSSAARTRARQASSSGSSTVAASGRGPAVASKAAGPVSPSDPVRAPAELIPVIPARSAPSAFSSGITRYTRNGGAVQPALLLTNINPAYPPEARMDGISGPVELRFKISTTGDVHDIVVVKGPQVLAQAAVDAVRQRRYKPARVDGVPTETDASAIFDFKLN